MSSPDPSTLPGRALRTVRADRAFAWYSEALRLFKKQPVGFALLAVAVTLVEIALTLIPVVGPPAANVVVPIVASSLLFAALATDRDDKPRLAHLVAPFAAPVHALAAMIAAALVVSGAEWLAGWHFADLNLLSVDDLQTAPPRALVMVYVLSVLVSLPLTLVPLFAFFEGAGPRDAFGWSVQAFARNVPAFLLYGGLSIALLGIVFVTQGIATPIVLPLWAASSYAAWKDLTGVAG
jgi:hypothetical protein